MQSFSFLSFFSADSKLEVETEIINNKINILNIVVADLLPMSPG
tara:strand:- start:446 stop:577 length:132 start_codon:yes stop_codon:yes gene_type:complete